MTVCPQCGTRLPGEAVFCPNCGYSPETPDRLPAVPDEKTPTDGAVLKKTRSGGKPAALLLPILAILLVAATALVWKGVGSTLFSPVPRSTKMPGVAVAGSGYVGQSRYHVTVNGAEPFTDLDGDSALRIYFEFTNDNWESSSVSATRALRIQASQDGKELGLTYSIENEAVDAAGLSVRPGVTIQCGASFKYKPGGGIVDVSVFGRQEDKAGGVVTATYLPESLPGAPLPFSAARVDAPDWMEGVSHEGNVDSYFVSIYNAVPIRDIHGNPAIRIYYAFSNSFTQEISMYSALRSMAYQDGIELIPSHTEPEPEQDAAYYENVLQGDTVLTSRVFRLRNTQSPVEAAVEAETDGADNSVGRVFKIC